ncbi:MAG: ComEC/Rec2 family competence protein [Clostridia bacterium]|nr:ComEC/Rec2 family competence protein [Clostridia bacterium]
MNIFGGRPGIAAGVLAVIATLAAFFLLFWIKIAILISVAVLISICIILFFKKKITGYRLFSILVVLSVFLIVFLRAFVLYFVSIPKAQELCGSDSYVHATVRERRSGADYYTNYIIDIHSVNGVECDQKAELSCEYNSDLQKGYEFVLRHADIVYYEELEESKARKLIADGIFLSVTSADSVDCAILSENNLTLSDHFEELNKYLSTKLRNEIKGDEGRLAVAMLLGDKSALKSEMHRDFSRAGLSHYLAVSGLHVSIITGIVGFILVKIGMRRSRRNLLLALFAVAYLFLLGFPISAVRAVIMLLAVFIAYSSGDISDSLNSLGIAASMILIVTPTAVFEASFILSFCATLGIVCFMPLFNELMRAFLYPKKSGEEKKAPKLLFIFKKILSFVFGTLMSVASALSLTLLPTVYLFGEMSRLGFKSNLIATVAATPLMMSLLLYLVFGGIPYIREGLLFVIRKSAGFMLGLASDIGDERGALVSLISKPALIIIYIFTAVILFLLIIKVKNKKPILLAPASYPLMLALLVFVGTATLPHQTEITSLSLAGSEYILAVHEDESAIIDVSLGSLNGLRVLSTMMHERGITEVDTLVLTHYHSRHLSAVTEFTSDEKVRRVLLPYPETEADAWIMLQLADTLEASGISCEIMQNESFVLLGETSFYASPIRRLERSSHPVISFSLSEGEERLTYISASSWEADETELTELLNKSDTVIFGSHGPVVKSSFGFLDDCKNVEKFVIFNESHIEYILDRDNIDYENIEILAGGVLYKTVFSNP